MQNKEPDKPEQNAQSVPQQVAIELRREIVRERQSGDKLPGMRQLRERFDVSISTIGAALDMLAGDNVVEKRRGSGVYVAEGGGRPRIGILSELDLFDLRISPYFRVVAQSLRAELRKVGAEPRTYVGHAEPRPDANREPTCPEFWADAYDGKLDGALLLDMPTGAVWASRVRDCAIPMIGDFTPYAVEIDFTEITDAAVRALVARGCRKIGLLAWGRGDIFRECVVAHGLETCDAWIRSDVDPALRGVGWEGFRDVWLAEARPDGLVILDDMLFADAQLAIMELGVRVPEELQLAVLINRNASPLMRLPAVTLEIDPVWMAKKQAEMIMQLVRGETPESPRPTVSFREAADLTAGLRARSGSRPTLGLTAPANN